MASIEDVVRKLEQKPDEVVFSWDGYPFYGGARSDSPRIYLDAIQEANKRNDAILILKKDKNRITEMKFFIPCDGNSKVSNEGVSQYCKQNIGLVSVSLAGLELEITEIKSNKVSFNLGDYYVMAQPSAIAAYVKLNSPSKQEDIIESLDKLIYDVLGVK